MGQLQKGVYKTLPGDAYMAAREHQDRELSSDSSVLDFDESCFNEELEAGNGQVSPI